METLKTTAIGEGVYTTEALPTGRYQVQVIGNGTVAVYESVDGVTFSRGRRFSVVGSACWMLELPSGGAFYLRFEGDEPIIKYITD